jgi:hypothetical protein
MHTSIFNNNLIKLALLSTLLLFSTASNEVSRAAPTGSILYARSGASGACLSWAEACDLQSALDASRVGDEIWVAAGVYYPGDTGSRTATFHLRNGVALYGGFGGWETSRQQRDWSANLTLLSGDIDRNGLLDSGNAYHVVTALHVDATAVLDGFTITAGNANGDYPYDTYGGGMVVRSSSPRLNNLVFHSNRSAIRGGGLFIGDNSSPTMTNVTFSANRTNYLGGGMFNLDSVVTMTNAAFYENTAVHSGGGIYNDNSAVILTNAAFSGNEAGIGGGMANHQNSRPRLTNITFSENHAKNRGGGIYNDRSSPQLTNVTFSINLAEDYGGGMYNEDNSSPTLTNVTFTGNIALGGVGGAMYSQGSSSPVLTNSILWANEPEEQIIGPATVTYSNVQISSNVVYPGEGNINADPLLDVLSANGGYTLTHALLWGSPAINAGHPFFCPPIDQRGMPRPADGSLDGEPRCDMGAFEFQLAVVYLPVVRR